MRNETAAPSTSASRLADAFGRAATGAGGIPPSLASLRAFQNAFNAYSPRLREILNLLRGSKISEKATALQELSEILSYATEDTLPGNIQVDSLVAELVRILEGDFGPKMKTKHEEGRDNDEDGEGDGDDDGEDGDGDEGDGDDGDEGEMENEGGGDGEVEVTNGEAANAGGERGSGEGVRLMDDAMMMDIQMAGMVANDLGLTAEEMAAFGFATDMGIGGIGGFGGGGGSASGGGGDDMQIVACRCLANLMEALPGSSHNVAYGGAIPVLCAKLTNITYIELAEQTISTIHKIAEECPGQLAREVQRSAMDAVSRCCQKLSIDCFPLIRDIVPQLAQILHSGDKKLVESACQSFANAVHSFQSYPEKLEVLLPENVLESFLGLLVPPNSSNIDSSTYVTVLKALTTASEKSTNVAVALMDLGVGKTIFQVMTGVEPPEEGDNGMLKKREDEGMLVIQNLVHRPKERVLETLNLTVELLPALPKDGLFDVKAYKPKKPKEITKDVRIKREEMTPALPPDNVTPAPSTTTASAPETAESTPDIKIEESSVPPTAAVVDPHVDGEGSFDFLRASMIPKDVAEERRAQLLREGSDTRLRAVQVFYSLLLPTLVDVYSASVSPSIRRQAVLAMLKMVTFCETNHLHTVLEAVPMANLLSSILTAVDQTHLVTHALQIAELLLEKMPDAYHLAFRKEGVMYEIERIAIGPILYKSSKSKKKESLKSSELTHTDSNYSNSGRDLGATFDLPSSSRPSIPMTTSDMQNRDLNTYRARHLRERYITADSAPAAKAKAAMDGVAHLVGRLVAISSAESMLDDAEFAAESKAILGEVVELLIKDNSMSSFELLQSGLVDALLQYCTNVDCKVPVDTRTSRVAAVFLENSKDASNRQAFSILVKRLQEALSRLEEFEVISVNSPNDSRSTISMIARPLKIRLIPEEGTVIPRLSQNCVYSIQGVATFEAFTTYLRPKMHLGLGGRSGLSGMLAAFAAAAGYPPPLPSGTSALSQLGEGSILPSIPNLSTSPGRDDPSRRRSNRLGTKDSEAPSPSTSAPSTSMLPSTSAPMASGDEFRDKTTKSKSSGDLLNDARMAAKLPTAAELERLMDLAGEGEEEIVEDELDPSTPAEDRPVTLQVGADGSKIEAHTPDGTRVATPTIKPTTSTSSEALRPRTSYAAALKSEPTDFHFEFIMDGEVIPLGTTIYGAIHKHEGRLGSAAHRDVWSQIYQIKFRQVPGPAPPADVGSPEPPLRQALATNLPDSIAEGSKQGTVLQLMRVLHGINHDWKAEGHDSATVLPEAAFVNNKLTAKLNRQLEEAMIVASSCLPDWVLDLPHFFPFLFPFESRYQFLQSTSFGYARVMQRLVAQHARREEFGGLGRIQRSKVRISRNRLFESSFKVLEMYGSSRTLLEVEFFDEVGTGLGPTLEFYALVCKEFCRKDLLAWREGNVGVDNPSAFIHSETGLFPSPLHMSELDTETGRKRLQLFRTLGQFVAKATVDSRTIDLAFSIPFMKLVLDKELPPTIASVKAVDPAFGSSLQHLASYLKSEKSKEEIDRDVKDLALDFTMPRYGFPLKEGGENIDVTMENLQEYIDLCVDWTVGRGVSSQVQAFRGGFSYCFPVRDLQTFSAEELVMLFGNADEDWTVQTLHDNLVADHGYTIDSRVVNDLLTIMSDFDMQQRRIFLSFVTGSPRLPIGGFAALNPRLTIVRKPPEDGKTPDDYLISVMTCVQYVKLPEYSSKEVLKKRLFTAMFEGQNSFHLS
ncbi:hypothetical protein BT69DRAFT_385596 [Atractiella rhizophila]|nr:hypothetical protein BT69DRAFT_385596 [Atractiella rhizophila]